MPQHGITLGADCSLSIQDANGTIIANSVIQDFEASPDTEKRRVQFLDGNVVPLSFPQGYKGSFSIVREDATIDTYFALKEAAYYNKVDVLNVTITQSVTETDGSITQYQFTQCDLVLDDAGKYMNNQEVIQKVSFEAKRRLILPK